MSSKLTTRIRTAVTAAAVAALAVPAMASAASCPATGPSAPTFLPWLDLASYSLLPGGNFETGTAGWTLSNASVAPGNEPWKVSGSADSKALYIKAGGQVVSPWFCVDYNQPTFRLFARRTNGLLGGVTYRVRWYDQSGRLQSTTLGSTTSVLFSNWQPSAVLPLGLVLPLWQSGGTLRTQLVMEVAPGSADMAVDDIYIDPYMRS